MNRGFSMPCEGSKYHGWEVGMPWVGGQNTMDKGVQIPWIGGSIYHG